MKGCIYLPLQFLNVWDGGQLLSLNPEATQVLQEVLKHSSCGELCCHHPLWGFEKVTVRSAHLHCQLER